MHKTEIFNFQGVELFLINNFLSKEECDYLCHMIKSKNEPSSVVGSGEDNKVYVDKRTSKSAFLNQVDDVVVTVDQRISDIIGITPKYGEPLQGQLYNEGDYFDDHHDYFDEQTVIGKYPVSGQRTWTCMIYLNHVIEGGNTEFPLLGKSINPELGTAIFWRNSEGMGYENPNTLHSGRAVLKGEKLIVTKWFRENIFDPEGDLQFTGSATKNLSDKKNGLKRNPINVKIEYVNGIPHARYRTNKDIPAVTDSGFKVVKIPSDLYGRIKSFYDYGRMNAIPEFDPANKSEHLAQVIKSNKTYYPTEMIPLTEALKDEIFREVQKVLEQWTKRSLESTYCYGIRTYKRGATLIKHIDGFETRIISAILNIDQQVDEPWPLQIDDHMGAEHEIFLEPGEMALYESAVLMHGRIKPLNGDYYSNLFVHYVNVN